MRTEFPSSLRSRGRLIALAVAVVGLGLPTHLLAADQPQWGQAWTRNLASSEKGLPATFDPKTGENIKWVAKLGSQTHSTPIIANGRVYIGTNNEEPRDPKHQGDRGVMMCFEEATGKLLWQLVVPKRFEDPYFDWPKCGIPSEVTVEGDRVYTTSNRGEVLCLDARGMANGNDGPFKDEAAHMTVPDIATNPPKAVIGAEIKPEPLLPPSDGKLLTPGPLDADILWAFDMQANAGIWPHDGAHSSILIQGDYLYVNTATGVDNTHKRIRTPDAPSLIVLDKRTGRLVAREREGRAEYIFHNTWSSPAFAKVKGRSQLFFAGGDGVLYSYEPMKKAGSEVATLQKLWWFDFDPNAPKENIHAYSKNRTESPVNFYGMPVVYKDRIYLAGGGDVFWGKNEAWLKCIDATKGGDISKSGTIWSYALNKHVMSTVAIADGLVFIADCGRAMHCVDAETGQPYWTHEIQGDVWASPMVADGKVYLGTRSGDFWTFAATRQKQVLSKLSLVTPISSTATAANGVLYVATMKELFALKTGSKWQSPVESK